MKRISYSHNPTISQINSFSLNLKEKFNRTFDIEINHWSRVNSDDDLEFSVSMLPGLNKVPCTIFYFSLWKELLSWYLKVMKEGLPNE